MLHSSINNYYDSCYRVVTLGPEDYTVLTSTYENLYTCSTCTCTCKGQPQSKRGATAVNASDERGSASFKVHYEGTLEAYSKKTTVFF